MMIETVSPNTSPIFVDSTEPEKLVALGQSSAFPRSYGADLLKSTPNGLAAIQRKEFPGDFLSSISDGRMADLLPKLGRATFPLMILEGRPKWTSENMLQAHAEFTKSQFYGFLYSLQVRHGIPWILTDNLDHTREAAIHFFAWCSKDHSKPSSLERRPGPSKFCPDKQWAVHFLQGLPGVGPGLARDLLDHFGNIRGVLAASRDDLLKCKGMGRGRVDRIMQVLAVANG